MDTLRALDLVIPTGRLPKIFLTDDERARAKRRLDQLGLRAPVLCIGIGASRETKVWPLDRFAAIAVRWVENTGGSVAVFNGKDEREAAAKFFSFVDDKVVRWYADPRRRAEVRDRIQNETELDLRLMAAIFSHARAYVGNDSGPKHLGRRLGCTDAHRIRARGPIRVASVSAGRPSLPLPRRPELPKRSAAGHAPVVRYPSLRRRRTSLHAFDQRGSTLSSPRGARTGTASMSRRTLSACIITLNEEQNLGRALASLAWVDEIIVVDGGSTDRTREIALDPNAAWISKIRLIESPWAGFRTQRTIAMRAASHDWILVLDSDEACSPELRTRLEKLLASDKLHPTWKIRRQEYFLGKKIGHGIWNPSYQDRFFHRAGVEYVNEIHEYPKYPTVPERIHEPILHSPAFHPEHFLAKMNKYTTIEARDRVREGRRTNLFRVLTSGPAMFFKNYFYYGAYKDGAHGTRDLRPRGSFTLRPSRKNVAVPKRAGATSMKISGFTIVRHGVRFDYPFLESIRSLLPIVDEYVVNVGIGDDENPRSPAGVLRT